MSDQARLSFESIALLTTSTVNTLHFPGLSTSGISDVGGSRRASFLLDGIGMCESMTESFCSTNGQDDIQHTDTIKLERKDSTKKRRSRKAQYDATIDGIILDKIETVNPSDIFNEPDDAWLIDIPIHGDKHRENIFSWVHKEFQSNDINANKHRLLCKLDDMSNARTIRSVSCHNFLENVNQSSDSNESVKNGRLSSPLRSSMPERTKSPVQIPISNGNSTNTTRLDYTDLEVMAKVQLENLRQADRQGPLTKRFGGSNVSLASTKSSATKPPPAPKSAVIRSSIRPNSYQRSTTQTVVSTTNEIHSIVESKPPVTLATRVSLLPNSANNNRTRPPIYRSSQTKPISNNLLNDVSNKPLTGPLRSQVGTQRRTMLPQTSALPRSSSSSFSQGRKSGIPTVDKPQKPTTSNLTRFPSTSSRNLSRSRIPTPVSSWNDGCY